MSDPVMNGLDAPKHLPIGSVNKVSTGWWGVWTLIVTEAALFGYLLVSYYYLHLQTERQWPPEGLPSVFFSGLNTFVLISSSGFMWGAERALRGRRIKVSAGCMAVAIVLGVTFILIQLKEYHDKTYGITTNLYGSLYFTITGFHLCHVAVGVIILSLLMLWTSLGYFDDRRYSTVTIGSVYWHFVDVVWLFIFSTFFLLPYIE